MRRYSTPMSLVVLPLVALAAIPACDEEVPSCARAVEVTFDQCNLFFYGYPPYGPGDLVDDPDGALAYCESTLAEAREAGCEGAHARFRSCLGSRRQCVNGYPEEICDREEAALHACLTGQSSFELDCGNGKDDDGDGLIDCWDPDCLNARECRCWLGTSIPQSNDRAVDLLFVIDDSGSISEEQSMVQMQIWTLMQELRYMTNGMPDVHIGVTSTNLGAGDYGITFCEDEGDQGRLLTGSCTNPLGAPYIVDVVPRSCMVERDSSERCTNHTCSQGSCAFEPTTRLEVDAVTGCPRCRNYAGQELEDVFSCIAGLGTQGCGFEQPLESMYLALDDNPANQGFFREEATLGVVFLTDEDDCSASDPYLFDNSATGLEAPLGPLTAFRCFEFGVTCDDDSRWSQGVREYCTPRSDPDALLHPISRYIDFLWSIKDPQLLVMAAIAGPVTNQQVTVGQDEYGQPEVQTSCWNERGGAVPGIRLKALIDAFHTPVDLTWAYTSICSPSYTDALQGLGRKVKDTLDYPCFSSPLRGCPDIGAELGVPMDSCESNDVCRPTCRVTDVHRRGTEEEESRWVPPCLEVCPDGPCPGNTDRGLAYAAGHPQERDPGLPVEACWHIRYQALCLLSNGSEIVVARRADPPPRSFSLVGCIQIGQIEMLCNDGVDNDEDCLVDGDDPDCQAW